MPNWNESVSRAKANGEIGNEDKVADLRTSFSQAVGVDPRKAAGNSQLSQRTGLPLDMVDRNPETAEKQNRFNDIDIQALNNEAPITAGNYMDQEFARQAHNDVVPLSSIEKVTRGFKRGQLISQSGMVGFEQLQSPTPEREAEIQQLDAQIEALPASEEGFVSKWLDPAAEIVGQLSVAASDSAGFAITGALSGMGAATVAGQAGPQIATPEEALTVPTAGLAGFGTGMTYGMGQHAFKVEAGHSYMEMLDVEGANGEKIDQETARYAAIGVGTINAALELTGLKTVAAPVKATMKRYTVNAVKDALKDRTMREAVVNFGRNYSTAWAGEVSTEVLQEIVTMEATEMAKSLSEGDFESMTQEEWSSRVQEIFSKVGRGMAVLSAPGASVNFASDIQRVGRGRNEQQRISELMKAAGDSELRTNNKERFRQLVRQLGDNSDASTVYINPEGIERLFQEGAIPPDVQEMESVQKLQQEYEKAVTEGRDVEISLEDMATDFAGTGIDEKLLPHMKLDPESMTVFEESNRDMQAEVDRILSIDQDQREAQYEVYNDVLGQELGRGVERSRAEVHAAMQEAFFQTRAQSEWAQQNNLSAADIYNRYQPRFVNEVDPALSERARQLDDVDVLLERIRTGDVPQQEDIYGESLLQFVRSAGGLTDEGGELSARDAQLSNLVRNEGRSLDDVAEIAEEAGYISERDPDVLLEAIDRELGGDPVFSTAAENQQLQEVDYNIRELQGIIEEAGIDMNEMSNEQIRASLLGEPLEEGGDVMTQGPIQEGGVSRSEIDPNTLIFREDEQNQLEAVRENFPEGEDYFPAVTVRTDEGIEIIDGHNRASVAIERGDQLPIVEIPESSYDALQEAGYDDMEIAYASLSQAGEIEAAEAIDRQFPGARVGIRGDDAAELLSEMQPADDTQLFQQADPTDSEAFQEWFGDSKVVDEQGEPLVVYHGSESSFSTFAFSEDLGFHFGTQEAAQERLSQTGIEEGGIRPFYLAIKNPLELRHDPGEWTVQEVAQALPDDIQTGLADKAEADYGRSATDIGRWLKDEGGHEALRRELQALGHDGVRYGNAFEGGDSFVAFNPEQIKSATDNQGTFDRGDPNIFRQDAGVNEYFQSTRSIPAGYFSRADNRLVFTKKQNLTTFIHESAHLFLDVYSDLAQAGDMEAAAELETLKRDYFQSDTIGRREHEMFASGFEAYFMEGKAPTPELQDVFSRVRQWMLMWYRRISEVFRRNPDIDPDTVLNDEVRGVMDRMLASQDAIAAANIEQQYQPMDVEHLGLSEDEAAEYQRQFNDAREEAEEDILASTMRDLARERRKWWVDGVEQRKTDIGEELANRPEYRARDFFSGDRVPEGMEHQQLDYTQVKNYLGAKQARRLGRMTASQGGMSIRHAASLFGYRTGEELLQALVGTMNKQDRAAWIQSQAEAQMREDNPGMTDVDVLEETAEMAVHSDKQADVLLRELQILNRQAGNETTRRQFFKAAAQRRVAEMPVRTIRPDVHRRNETKARSRAVSAAAEGNYQQAARAQEQAIFQFYQYREAREALNRAESTRKRLKQISSAKYSARQVDPNYIQAVKVLVAAYDMRKQPRDSQALLDRVNRFIAAQKESNPDLIADSLLSEIHVWKDMNINQLQAVRDAAENILTIGKQNSEAARETYRAEVTELSESIKANTREAKPPISNRSKISRMNKGGREFRAVHRKYESFLQELDGWDDQGIAQQKLFVPLWEAQLEEMRRGKAEHEALYEIFSDYQYLFNGLQDNLEDAGVDFRQDVHEVPVENGPPVRLSRAERVVLALNYGNEGNREALRRQKNRNMRDEDIIEAIGTLTEDELQLVNRIWEYVDKFYPELSKIEQEATGISPAKVEASPFTVNGVSMRGGYYPLQADSALSWRAEMHSVEERAEQLKQGVSIRASTKHGSTIERTDFAGQVVNLSIEGLFKHVDGVVHDITHRDAVRQVDRFLRNETLRDAITDSIGAEGYKNVVDAVTRMAGGDTHPTDLSVISSFMRFSRVAASYGAIGYSLRTGLLNVTGLGPAATEVSKLKMLSKVFEEMSRPLEMGREIKGKSTFMENRAQVINRDVYAVLRNLKGNRGWEAVKANAFIFIQKMDAFVSRASWMAAYEEAIHNQMTEENAILHADRTVSRTQGNGLKIDLSAVEDSSEIIRAFSPMYTYFNAMYNLGVRQRGRAQTGQISKAKFIENMFWIFMAVPIVEELILGADDDHEFNNEDAARYGKAVAGYYAGQWFGVREFSSYIQYGMLFETPAQRTVLAPFRLGGEVLNVTFDPEQDFDKGTISYATDMMPLLGIPTGAQISRTGRYLMDIEQSGQDASIYSALFTGQTTPTDAQRIVEEATGDE